MKIRSTFYSLVIFIFGLSFWGASFVDPDLGWHLLGGEFVFTNHSVPGADFISSHRSYWHDYHWLYQLGLFSIFQLYGYVGLSLAFGILSGITFFIFFQLLRKHFDPDKAFFLFFIVYLLLQPSWVLRPQAVSLLSLVFCQWILERRFRFELPLLFGIAVIISNIHVYWVFIPLLWVFYRVVPRFWDQTCSPLYVWGGAFLLGGAALISPYGLFHEGDGGVLLNYAVLWDYLFLQESIRSRVVEMFSPFSIGGYIGPFLFIVTLILARSINKSHFQKNPGAFFFVLFAFILTFSSAKYLGVLGISLLWVFPELFSESQDRLFAWIRSEYVSSVALVLLAFSSWSLVFRYPNNFKLPSVLRDAYPIEECAFIATQEEPLKRVLTHFNTGGWCAFSGFQESGEYGLKVLVDNRTQGVPDDFYRRAFELYDLKGNWLQALSEWRYDYIVIAKSRPLAQLLSRDMNGWSVLREGKRYAVFKKKA